MASKPKSWNEKLHTSKDLPKLVNIPAKMAARLGVKGKMLVPSPIEVDAMMRRVRRGQVTTVAAIREKLARKHGAAIACPLATGIFCWIAANAAEEKGGPRKTPYWRTLKTGGVLNEKYPGGALAQKRLLEAEGQLVIQEGKFWKVESARS